MTSGPNGTAFTPDPTTALPTDVDDLVSEHPAGATITSLALRYRVYRTNVASEARTYGLDDSDRWAVPTGVP